MQMIDWSSISDEQFQDLCIRLLFREGYRNVTPLGSRGIKEEGRDAIEETMLGESKENKLIVFQFKRWTVTYSDSAIKERVKKELDTKILLSGRKVDEYRLVTCHPLTKLKKWFFDELPLQYPFPVRYFEKAWLENRLESESQDLRRHYFGIYIERHSPQSLIQSCRSQTEKAIRSVGVKYIADLYIKRPIENEINEFLHSDKSCFLIVDRSGQGKTNVLCHLAEVLRADMPVLMIFGSRTITKEDDLAMNIVDELGYSSPLGTRWQSGLDDIVKVSQQAKYNTLILIDGISENNDLVTMKKALRSLLDKYGNEKNIKFVFTCRDSFWPRFRADFPVEYVYKTKSQVNVAGDKPAESAQFLGDWSDIEFEAASSCYSEYFNIQFSLSESAKDHCKYPLLFRLFCETYSNKNVGFVAKLPFRKVFTEFFDAKVQRIADYFDIDFSPDRIRASILRVREKMWLAQDANSLSRSELGLILNDFDLLPSDAVLARMCDEGIFLQTSINKLDNVRFAFDELSDYFLFVIFSEQYLMDYHSDIERINHMCQILKDGDDSKKLIAEKFLSLISQNTEDPVTLSHLLSSLLVLDLSIFSQCAWQRLTMADFSQKSDVERIRIFGERLIYFYDTLTKQYFPIVRPELDPFIQVPGDLGLTATSAPNIRELSYSYKIVTDGEDVLEIKVVDIFPTWSLSFDDHKLHDPENGILISNFRNFPNRGVLHSLDFEWNSPFKGVSLDTPDRVALHDLWTEIAYVLDNHQILEPKDLLIERANSLSKKLPGDLRRIKNPKDFLKTADRIEETLLEHREKIEFQKRSREYLYYLTVLETNSFEEFLPPPDLSILHTGQPLQSLYSEQGLVSYLQKLFLKFRFTYPALISKNFSDISQYLNLFQQLPSSFVIFVNSARTYLRVFVLPEEKDSEAELRVGFLPPEADNSISDGVLRVADNKPVDEAVKEELLKLGKRNRLITPIDTLIPIEDLFIENPINNLTINWIKTELAQLLGRPFGWPNI